MLTARSLIVRSRFSQSLYPGIQTLAARFFSTDKSSTPAPVAPPSGDGAVAIPVEEKLKKMTQASRALVWGATDDSFLPANELPERPKEMVVLDPTDVRHRHHMDGTERTVVIRQLKKSPRQDSLNPENLWKITFYEDGETSERWNNSLMGWISNADPFQSAPPLYFKNASEAVYFAKKRGWNYVVHRPTLRYARRDGTRYQDNFLPKLISTMIRKEGMSIRQWKRSEAGTSHFFRPLKYHGDGEVRQHGPNSDLKPVAHVKGQFKPR